ncbi:hypothetical protein [Phenylobacterium sp.]|uniref:hypothetical protein n=1 Tax=Phenylobacterium sp. TaxID=1871053 RepID=UPI0030F442CB
MRNLWTVAAVGALMAGCNPQSGAGNQTVTPGPASVAPVEPASDTPAPDSAVTGFSHAKGEDLFGYYIPNTEVKSGTWKLDNIAILDEAEFAKWEAGDTAGPAGPVMFEFSDTSSATSENELGQTVYAKRTRILPTSYRIGGGDIQVTGTDVTLGQVTLDGTIDMAALKRARATGPGAKETILRTGLMIGSTPFKNLSFNWFGGD